MSPEAVVARRYTEASDEIVKDSKERGFELQLGGENAIDRNEGSESERQEVGVVDFSPAMNFGERPQRRTYEDTTYRVFSVIGGSGGVVSMVCWT
jgi:hypothetical protein